MREARDARVIKKVADSTVERRASAGLCGEVDLMRALDSRISAFISNEPGSMIASLRSMYRGCMGT